MATAWHSRPSSESLQPCWNGKKVDATCAELSAADTGEVGPCPACAEEMGLHPVAGSQRQEGGFWVVDVVEDTPAYARSKSTDNPDSAEHPEHPGQAPLIDNEGRCVVCAVITFARLYDALKATVMHLVDATDDSTGASRIAAERRRQVGEEGYTPAHDQEHGDGELLDAAYGYIRALLVPEDNGPLDLQLRDGFGGHPDFVPHNWPWAPETWKPTPGDPIRQLTKAGALIAAEIDRLVALNALPEPF